VHNQKRSINRSVREHSTKPPRTNLLDIDALLSKPTWSVRSLLPDPNSPPSEEIAPTKLHHLLRLSALPLPTSPEEEAEMLKTLHSQLHFVKDIQKVDTEGVEPLQSIRDETEEGAKDITIGMNELKEAFEKEEIKGRNRRPRRRRVEVVNTNGVEDWDVLGTAGEKVELAGGQYFVVRSGKE
jgi:Asp-tRNA(Asn)/Glu-tRNA(Gln) amidotransferase C subunit